MSATRTTRSWRPLLAVAGMIVLGIGTELAAIALGGQLASVLGGVASALLAAAFILLSVEYLVSRPAVRDITDLLASRPIVRDLDTSVGVAAGANAIGMVECAADSSLYDFTDVLCDSQKLVIVLNDGRTWSSVHRDRLRRRFEDSTKETTIFLIHPESDMLSVLARKGSIDPEVLRARINETLDLLREIMCPSTRLEVLGHFLFNPHSLVVTERQAIITPYFASRGGRTVPLYVFEDLREDCYYRQLVKDMEGLRMDSRSLLGPQTDNLHVLRSSAGL